MSRNWIWVIVIAALWTGSAAGNDKNDKPKNENKQRSAAKPPAAQRPTPQAPKPQAPVQKPPAVQAPVQKTPAQGLIKPKTEPREEFKPGKPKPNLEKAVKENFSNPNGSGIGADFGNRPANRPQNSGGGNPSFKSPQQQHGDHDHDHDHHHGQHGGRVQTGDLIRLFLYSNSVSSRPYGYGGYGYGPGFGRYQYGSPVYVVPVIPQQQYQEGVDVPPPPRLVVPTPEQFGSLAMPHQRELLLHAINSLDNDLTRVGTGSQWKKHLQLAGLSESLTEVNGPLDAPDREKFRKHAEVFDGVAQDPAFRSISGLWGFGTLRVGLREFAEEPIVKIRRAIAINAGWLSKALDEVATGAQWKTHLRLEALMARDDQVSSAAEALDRFEPVLTKFDKVQADPQFESVSEMQGFQATHAALSDFVQELRLAAAPPPAVSQEIPAPMPPAPKKEE